MYVNDLIIAGDTTTFTYFKAYLSDCFKMKDLILVLLNTFLTLRWLVDFSGLFLCQYRYILDIIFATGLLGAKPSDFPIKQHHQLGLASSALLQDPKVYRCLIYLVVTGPDLAYLISSYSFPIHAISLPQALGGYSLCCSYSFTGWLTFLGNSPNSWKQGRP